MSKLNEPMTPLTRSLLHTIPRKTFLWLQSLGVDVEVPGEHALGDNKVAWDFEPTKKVGHVSLEFCGLPIFTVYWDLDLVDSAGTYLGQPLDEPLENNLARFVGFETTIYGVLEDLDKKLRDERNKSR